MNSNMLIQTMVERLGNATVLFADCAGLYYPRAIETCQGTALQKGNDLVWPTGIVPTGIVDIGVFLRC